MPLIKAVTALEGDAAGLGFPHTADTKRGRKLVVAEAVDEPDWTCLLAKAQHWPDQAAGSDQEGGKHTRGTVRALVATS